MCRNQSGENLGRLPTWGKLSSEGVSLCSAWLSDLACGIQDEAEGRAKKNIARFADDAMYFRLNPKCNEKSERDSISHL